MTCTDAASVELARAARREPRHPRARALARRHRRHPPRRRDVELEVFVHGALCVAYSGQCLTSEAIGGRSANRGACAQACRLPYELVVDGVLQDLGDRAYLLSPEDLEASALVPRARRARRPRAQDRGAAQGARVRGGDHRASIAARSTAAVGEAAAPAEDERRAALQMFSRGSGPGFLAGVDHQRLVEARACDHRGVLAGDAHRRAPRARQGPPRGAAGVAPRARRRHPRRGRLRRRRRDRRARLGDRRCAARASSAPSPARRRSCGSGPTSASTPLPADGSRVWKTSDPARRARRSTPAIEREPHRVLHRRARRRSPRRAAGARSRQRARRERAASRGDTPLEQARVAPLTAETPCATSSAASATRPSRSARSRSTSPTAPSSRSPRSTARAARWSKPSSPPRRSRPRDLGDHRRGAARRSDRHPIAPRRLRASSSSAARSPRPQAAVDAGATGVYLDFLELTGTGAAVRALRARAGDPVHITLAPPRIRKPGEEKIDRYLDSLAPDALLVRSLGALRAHETQRRLPRIGDFSLNVTNRLTAAAVLGAGLAAFTPSFDLDAAQLLALLTSPFAPFAEVVVHHPMPLFHMEHCVIAALLSRGPRPPHLRPPLRSPPGLAARSRRASITPSRPTSAAATRSSTPSPQSAARARPRPARARACAASASSSCARRRPRWRASWGCIRQLLEGRAVAADVWRALRTESGYGVVRGSLRVLPA